MSVESIIIQMATDAKSASRQIAKCSSNKKNEVLLKLADKIKQQAQYLKNENQKDLLWAKEKKLSDAMIDRLKITDATIESMAGGLKDVVKQDDPVGAICKTTIRPNGLEVSRMRIPLGVIGIIYESRPNVTIDAACLCIKSGNAVILRGGSEAFHSNQALASLVKDTLVEAGLPASTVQVVPIREREAVNILLRQDELIDLIIPRGGEGLIRFVAENSKIPVLKHYKGVCHIYVDADADIDMAKTICFNAKVQRPGVCNAMEAMLVNQAIAGDFLPEMAKLFQDAGVEIRGCPQTCNILAEAKAAQESDWGHEYLDLVVAVRIVDGMDQAMEHIAQYGSSHTEAIITTDYANARRFLREVDSSVVLVNASTRFNDGGQLGLGAEMGISTSKLHAFGPMGLEELTTTKFVVFGNGQIRT
jgi:glutamate-5-semialdehyde dehydrogenase